MTSRRLRPKRSPSTPKVSSSATTGSRKASEIQVSCDPIGWKYSWNRPFNVAGIAIPTCPAITAKQAATIVPFGNAPASAVPADAALCRSSAVATHLPTSGETNPLPRGVLAQGNAARRGQLQQSKHANGRCSPHNHAGSFQPAGSRTPTLRSAGLVEVVVSIREGPGPHWTASVGAGHCEHGRAGGLKHEAAVRKHLIPGAGRHRIDRLRPEHLDQLHTAWIFHRGDDVPHELQACRFDHSVRSVGR